MMQDIDRTHRIFSSGRQSCISCANRLPIRFLHNREERHTSICPCADRAYAALGCSRIETINDDLGRSAAGGVRTSGFDGMVAEVCLARLGRWQHREVFSVWPATAAIGSSVIAMCRVVDTVPDRPGDGLCAASGQRPPVAWGWKGTLNEFEL